MSTIDKSNIAAGNPIRAADLLGIINALDGSKAVDVVLKDGSTLKLMNLNGLVQVAGGVISELPVGGPNQILGVNGAGNGFEYKGSIVTLAAIFDVCKLILDGSYDANNASIDIDSQLLTADIDLNQRYAKDDIVKLLMSGDYDADNASFDIDVNEIAIDIDLRQIN